MDQPIKQTNILILRGIYPDQFTLERPQLAKPEPTIVYTVIPKRFTGIANWPRDSNLLCWECSQLPTSYPKFIPMNPEKDSIGEDVCDTRGNFCEWQCVVRYITKEYPVEQHWDLGELVSLFSSKWSGKRQKILPCIPKTRMAIYCGGDGLSKKQWRDGLRVADLDHIPKISDYTDT